MHVFGFHRHWQDFARLEIAHARQSHGEIGAAGAEVAVHDGVGTKLLDYVHIHMGDAVIVSCVLQVLGPQAQGHGTSRMLAIQGAGEAQALAPG